MKKSKKDKNRPNGRGSLLTSALPGRYDLDPSGMDRGKKRPRSFKIHNQNNSRATEKEGRSVEARPWGWCRPAEDCREIHICLEIGTLLHPYALERSAFLCHLIHEAACFIVDLRPALVATRENLRSISHFALAAVSLSSVVCHASIVPTLEKTQPLIHRTANLK